MNQIEDGTGKGYRVRVDQDNRIRARAVSITEQADHANEGKAYNFNTGELTLTSANESAVMYIKNTGDTSFIITRLIVGLGPSTGGASTSIPIIKIIRNPTTGTIISDATDVDINSNRDFSSTNIFSGSVFKGGEGKTITNGTDHILSYQTDNGRLALDISEVLPKGTSLGVSITPQASNTSMTCYAAAVGYINGEV